MKRKEPGAGRVRRKCSKPSEGDAGQPVSFLSSPVQRKQAAKVAPTPRPRLTRFRNPNPRQLFKNYPENALRGPTPRPPREDSPLLPCTDLPPEDGALDVRAMEILHNVAARVTGSPVTFVAPNVVLGVPHQRVVGKAVGKAVAVVGVPWGEKESERRIGEEPWCREFYWRIVVHQLAKREKLPRQVLTTIIGRSSNSMLALLGGGAEPTRLT